MLIKQSTQDRVARCTAVQTKTSHAGSHKVTPAKPSTARRGWCQTPRSFTRTHLAFARYSPPPPPPPFECCFTSTETIRLIRDGEPRTATSTFTQLQVTNTKHIYTYTPGKLRKCKYQRCSRVLHCLEKMDKCSAMLLSVDMGGGGGGREGAGGRGGREESAWLLARKRDRAEKKGIVLVNRGRGTDTKQLKVSTQNVFVKI